MNFFIERELERRGEKGLVVSHGSILTALYKNNGELPMKEIADRINRSKSTVTQLVEKLINTGYVKKQVSAEDRRVHMIVLTEKGWQFKDIFIEISHEVNELFFADFSDLEIEMFLKMLLKIKNNFER